MKVVEIISSCTPGGAEILVKDLAIKLSKEVEVEIWAIANAKNKNFEKFFLQDLKSHNVNTIILGKRPNKDRIKTIFKLRDEIKKGKPDIINSHLEYVTFYSIASLIGVNVPLIQTIHNTRISYPLLNKIFSNKFVCKYIAVSKKVKEILEKQLKIPSNKINLIYNGINLKRFSNIKSINQNSVYNILAVGRLEPQKDYKNLLLAFKELNILLQNNNVHIPFLNIIGMGKLKQDLIRLAYELKIEKKVNFLGVRDDIPNLLKKNDLYVLSSKWEGLSISLIEALASGIPIVATNVGSNNEIIDNNKNGLLVDPCKPKFLAEAIYRVILNKKLREKFSRNGINKAKVFSIEKCSKGYLNVYSNLLENDNYILK